MKPFTKIVAAFALGLVLQGGVYYYLDQVLFAPSASFSVSNGKEEVNDKNFPDVKTSGKKYYSYDHQYMAVVTENSVDIYKANDSTPTHINLKHRKVSYFEWMEDRNLAIMGLYGDHEVTLARLDPSNPEHEVDTELEDAPRGSKIVDAAYSTATNVVYMKVEVGRHNYRMYRTDANYDTRRVYMQASDIGRIAVFYDEDNFFYDNAKTGDVFMFDGIEGGWRVINPAGRYRLIGVDDKKDIYIAKVNEENEVLSVSKGRLGKGFTVLYSYDKPRDLDDVTMDDVKEIVANDGGEGVTMGDTDNTNKDSDKKEKSKE
ncbi:MAG: hypothetical protein HUJ84_05015 [Veillonella sp.]|nr:hypothetical protein [Veillonella sp.]MCF0156712.1 hypothetical protein [Veillonella sp.]